MSQSFTTGRRRFLAAGAAALCVGPAVSAQPAAPVLATQITLEKLLDEIGAKYVTRESVQEPKKIRYELQVKTDQGSTDIVARELTLAFSFKDGSPARFAYFYIPVVRFPEAFAPSAALLKLLVDQNNDLVSGNVGIGKYGIFYSGSLWLRNADAELLADAIMMAHYLSLEVRQKCQPFVPGLR